MARGNLPGRIVDGVYQPWSGCQCYRCRNRLRPAGDTSYRATHEEYEQAEYEREKDNAAMARFTAGTPHIIKGEKFADYAIRVKRWRADKAVAS